MENPNHIDKLINYVEGVDKYFAENYLDLIKAQIIEELNDIRPYYNAGLMWYKNERQKKEEALSV
ncbi:hypothetical protein EG832_02110 [bacterium]|nr:hypothetical protein [bacterium]